MISFVSLTLSAKGRVRHPRPTRAAPEVLLITLIELRLRILLSKLRIKLKYCLADFWTDASHTVFSIKNKYDCYLMATEKVHSVIHSPNEVACFCHYLNHCCEAPVKGHKIWVGQQGQKTNQGPETLLSMMLHSLRKECSALLCEGVQGEFRIYLKHLLH